MHETPTTREYEAAEAPAPRRQSSARGLMAGTAVLALLVGIGLGAVGRGFSPPAISTPPGQSQPSAAVVSPPTASGGAAAASDLTTVAEKVGPAVVSIRTDEGLGSGVIYDPSGLILTNAHVVDGSREIKVELADRRQFNGRVLGADRGFDIAVVKIEGQNLPSAPLGDSASLQVGQRVAAIGNPYGFDHTVTDGVVSALNRPIAEGRDSYAQPMIQTNAAINPGNSGGPLVDLRGNVVGITTLVAAPQGFPAQGLGFAVPIDTAKRITPELVADGHVTHSGQPYLGVSLAAVGGPAPAAPAPFSGRQRPRSGSPSPSADHGALIQQVEPNGPASRADLRVGDVVTAFNGKEIYRPDGFLQELVLHRPGDQIQLGVLRNGQQVAVSVTLGEAPAR